MSILLQVTNMVMAEAATIANKSIDLSKPTSSKSAPIPKAVIKSNKNVVKAAKKLRLLRQTPNLTDQELAIHREAYLDRRKAHRRLVRGKMLESYCKSDAQAHSVLSQDPSKFFRSVRSMKSSANHSIKHLNVRDKVYPEDEVGDGLYDSISFLKTKAHADLESSETYNDGLQTYEHILTLCQKNQKISLTSLKRFGTKLDLLSMICSASQVITISMLIMKVYFIFKN